MKRTLHVLNEMERTGVLRRYAIGGAMAATFYVEPFLTFDLDVFVLLPELTGSLVTLTSLYHALREQGYSEERECVLIEGVPVQFLPAYNALIEEALAEARDTLYDDADSRPASRAPGRVCVQTGREKDRERVRVLCEQARLDITYLEGVLARYNLGARWTLWTQ